MGDGGIDVLDSDGQLYRFRDWNKTYRIGTTTDRTWYLTEIFTREGYLLAKVNHGRPQATFDGGSVGCPELDGGVVGVPYVSSVDLPDGLQLAFGYKAVLSDSLQPYECVLDKITATWTGGSQVLVQYAYAPGANGKHSGKIASATYPFGVESYVFNEALDGGVFQVSFDGQLQSSHALSGTTVASQYVVRAGLPSSELRLPMTATTTEANLDKASGNLDIQCHDGFEAWGYTDVSYAGALRGDGIGTRAGLLRRTSMMTGFEHSTHDPLPYKKTESCDASYGCSAGDVWFNWAHPGIRAGGIAHCYFNATRNKRGNWEVAPKNWVSVPGNRGETTELLATFSGASNWWRDAGGLEETGYTWGYSDAGVQQLTGVSRTSIYSSSAAAGYTIQRGYDGGVPSKIYQYGKTRNLGGTVVDKQYATFLRQARTCTDIGGDARGRIVQVEGPCEVTSATQTACSAPPVGQGSHPLTELVYYPITGTSLNSGRLQKVIQYPAGCSTTNRLVTEYSNYSVEGLPRTVLDPNGVTTTFTYSGRQVATRTIGARVWEFAWESKDNLKYVKFPEGNYEVYCYRSGTTSGCTGGQYDGRLQWRAKSADSSGSQWGERVDFEWGTDSLPELVRFRTPSEIRREIKLSHDGNQRLTWARSGTDAGFVGKLAYDGASNVVGIGAAFNLPPDFCRTSGGALSQLCSQLEYDRAERLTRFNEYPTGSGTGNSTCFDYDKQGNIIRVSSGCTTAQSCSSNSPGTLSTCSGSPSDYEVDDFGRVVRASLANSSNGGSGTGQIRSEHDARGNVLNTQTEQMAASSFLNRYVYDGLDRVTQMLQDQPSGQVTLFSQVFDQATAPGSCPSLLNVKGRVAYRQESIGTTWYSYDADGRVTAELRLRPGVTVCTTDDGTSRTLYTYSNNGNVTEITYPYGRRVVYAYKTTLGLNDRVASISTTWRGASAWGTTPDVAIGDVTWEPYSGLRSYSGRLHGTQKISVDYYLGDNSSAVPSSACPTTIPDSTTNYDRTGRPRSVWVTKTSGGSKIYKQTWTWKADQLAQSATCLLQTNGQTTNFGPPGDTVAGYDVALKLLRADMPNFATTGGPLIRRQYTYDARGNRTSEIVDTGGSAYNSTYAAAPLQDRLTSVASYWAGTVNRTNYSYDRDGRVVGRTTPIDSSGLPNNSETFNYLVDGNGTAGADTVHRSVNINGFVYEYVYDAMSRRRMKRYPTTLLDEYFYNTGGTMFVDRGNSSVFGGHWVADDYLWLDGKAVAFIRGAFNSSYARVQDEQGDCARNDEASVCGLYFVVNDYLPKPVLTLDSQARITGVGEYDPFGRVNQVDKWAETPHPYKEFLNPTIPSWYQVDVIDQKTLGLNMQVRSYFSYVDTDPCDWALGSPDFLYLGQESTGAQWSNSVYGHHAGAQWSSWVAAPSNGRVGVFWQSNGADPDPVSCDVGAGWQYRGAATRLYEYRRNEAGANAVFTPIRFPGQYHDAETQTHNNWFRTMDPFAGRYLQLEPLSGRSEILQTSARLGSSLNLYSYAASGPLAAVDYSGLFVTYPLNPSKRLLAAIQKLKSTKCGKTLWRIVNQSSNNYNLVEKRIKRTAGEYTAGETQRAGSCDGRPRVEVALDFLSKDFVKQTGLLWPLPDESLLAHELGHALDFEPNANSPIMGNEAAAEYFEYCSQ